MVTKYHTRSFRKFWDFIRIGLLSIIFPDYPLIGKEDFYIIPPQKRFRGEDKFSNIIRNSAGKVLSKGTALALHEILNLVNTKLRISESVQIVSGDMESEISKSQIILGGPRTNAHCESMLRTLNERFILPVSFVVNEKKYKIGWAGSSMYLI